MTAIQDQFKYTAQLIGEPIRATILWTLLDGRAFTATELAMAAETSASNISMHLSKLLQAGLLTMESQGRHRYYALAGKEIAYAVESLAALIPYTAKKEPPGNRIEPAIQQCRTCYDHLAGKMGVAITDALLKRKLITADEQSFELTAKGRKWFMTMAIPVDHLQAQRRSFLRPCLDWSERRYHMAGSLAAAWLNKMLEEQWIRKISHTRAVVVTAKGQKILYDALKV